MRPVLDVYFMAMAELVASRGTCDRGKVGCVLVRDKRVLATGYNGAPSGVVHCTEAGHALSVDGHCTRAIHAELNALLQCASYGPPVRGATSYSTTFPCWACFCALAQAGITSVVYRVEYTDREGAYRRVVESAADLGIAIRQFDAKAV